MAQLPTRLSARSWTLRGDFSEMPRAIRGYLEQLATVALEVSHRPDTRI